MPRMNGPEMVRRLRSWRRNLRVLYMSGHVDGASLEGVRSDNGVKLLHKPFTTDDLMMMVREVLDRPLRGA